MSSWTLEDVTITAQEFPDSFFIPPEAERIALRPEHLARLHFVLDKPRPSEPHGERMWVEIAERTEIGGAIRYRGFLTNRPAFIVDLRVGDSVEFGPEHIAQTILPADHPDAIEVGELNAMVSARVLEKGAGARWAYREKADRDEDSGWRLFAGDEPDEWIDDPENLRVRNVNWLAERDPSLRDIFRAEVGAAFERASLTESWQRVHDWSPPED